MYLQLNSDDGEDSDDDSGSDDDRQTSLDNFRDFTFYTSFFSLFLFSGEEGTQASSPGSVSAVTVAVPVVILLLIILSLVGFFVRRRYTAFCLLGGAQYLWVGNYALLWVREKVVGSTRAMCGEGRE